MTTTTMSDDIQVVPMTVNSAEVRLCAAGAPVSIGKVGSTNGRWFWQHRDGEQSSPVAANRTEAATALAEYHRSFKSHGVPAAPATPTAAVAPTFKSASPGQPVRRLLFA